MPSLRYDGVVYDIDTEQLTQFRGRVLEILRAGEPEWLELDYGENATTWLLVGPGIAVTLDEEDPPDMPQMPDLSALGLTP